jgi:Xaa-Pro aminopeptidase
MVEANFLPQPSLAERNRRWKAVREAMKKSEIDCLICPLMPQHYDISTANVRYLTAIGWGLEEAYVIFPMEAEPTIIIFNAATISWTKRASTWDLDVRGREGFGWAKAIIKRIEELNLQRGNIGITYPDRLPHQEYTEISAALSNAKITDATMLMNQVRMIKTAEEISFLRIASGIIDGMIEEIIKNAVPPRTEAQVFGKMVEYMICNGAEYPSLLLWDSGEFPTSHCGRTPTLRKLMRGDLINLELHARYAGYLGHSNRTISIGEPRLPFREIYRVALDAYNRAVSKIVPGAALGEIMDALYQPIDEAGMQAMLASLHSHGLETGEYPSYSRRQHKYTPYQFDPKGEKLEDIKLKENMVIAPVIEIENQSWKKQTGISLGDCLVVKSGGAQRLNRSSLEFQNSLA